MTGEERLSNLYDDLSSIRADEETVDEPTQKLVEVIMQDKPVNVNINEEANVEEISKALLSSLSRFRTIITLVKPGLDKEMSIHVKALENEMDTVIDTLENLNKESNHESKAEAIINAKEVLKNISTLIRS